MATTAAKITAITAHGQYLRTGTIVPYRLGLDGSQLHGGNNAVGQVIQRTMAVHMRLAEAALAMTDAAAPAAQVAAGGAIMPFFLEPGLYQLIIRYFHRRKLPSPGTDSKQINHDEFGLNADLQGQPGCPIPADCVCFFYLG